MKHIGVHPILLIMIHISFKIHFFVEQQFGNILNFDFQDFQERRRAKRFFGSRSDVSSS